MTLAPGTFGMLVDAAWRVTLILSAAWLLAAVLRRQAAAVRHAVWALALLAALAVPAVGGLVPEWRLPILPSDAVIDGPAPASAPSDPLAQAPSLNERARPGDHAAVAPSAPAPQASGAAARLSPGTARQAIDWLGLIWVTVAAMVIGRYVASVVSVRWVLRDAEPVDDPRWRDATDIAAAELGLRETPRVLASQSVAVPFTAGLFRPVVVVPALAVHHWSDERLRVVLLHELAHVSRRDCLMQALTQIACAAYWFNPLTWVAARRLRSERERACDDLVLAAGLRGSEYAQHLLDIARTANSRRALSAAALAMARPSELEGRLLAILDSRRAGSLSATGTSWRGIAVAALGVVVLASVQPVAREMAQAAPDSVGTDAAVAESAAPATRETVSEQPAHTPAPTPAPTPSPSPAPAPSATAAVVTREVGALVHSIATEVAIHAPAVASSIAVSAAEGVAEGIHEAIQEMAGTPQAAKADTAKRAVSPAVINGLTEAMKDPDPDVRKQALQGLTRLGAPIAFETLVAALKDPDSDIREHAAFALGRMKDVRAVAPLTSALSDEHADVREQAVFALSQMRATEALPALRKALSDASPDVREQALMALWQMRDPSSVPAFMQALKDESEDVREQAVFALSQMGDKSAVPALLAVLARDESEDVREQAAFALSQIGDESAVDGLTAALKDKSPDVRRQAVFALSQIGSGDSTPRASKRPRAAAPVVAPTPAVAPKPAPVQAPQAPQ
jgi:HEAT repeat protein/beta-lactamase regulating signal transducer with metallopeptidase domain